MGHHRRMMALARHTGRPTREESGEIPPKVRAALTLRAAGHSWKQCSDMTGASYRNLLKWKDLPIAEAYVEEKVKEPWRALTTSSLAPAQLLPIGCCQSR